MSGTISAIEGITGLKINYWAMVNLAGFRGPGRRRRRRHPQRPAADPGRRPRVPTSPATSSPASASWTASTRLWFARSRDSSDDYSRMARQKCVMNAMLHQVSPQTVLTNFEKIAKASSQMISTDIPASEVDRFMALALKAKSQPVATLSLVPPLVNTADPDIALIHRKVAEALTASRASRGASPPEEVAVDGHRGLDRHAQERVRRQRLERPRCRLLNWPHGAGVHRTAVRVARPRAVPLRRRARGRGRTSCARPRPRSPTAGG